MSGASRDRPRAAPGPTPGQLTFDMRVPARPTPVPAATPVPVASPASGAPALEAPPDLWDRGEAGPDDGGNGGDGPGDLRADAEAQAPARAPEAPAPVRSPAAPAPEAPARREPRIYTVSDLIRGARVMLEARFADVRVEGEVTGLRRSGPGHLYFCLKDGAAQVDCVMFSREASALKWKLADGQQVHCRGRLTIYEGRGKLQLSVVALEPAGAGLLALAFEELKRKLAAEGLFAQERKRPLPFLPRRIGVVTSRSGAVIRDIIRVAHRRAAIPLLLAPAPVQGEGAAIAIVAALRLVTSVRDVDVVILARGGGSLEDLWCFNDEGLARAIAACPVPVISGVGHETDFTIADFVADVRAPTPSAAAELARAALGEIRSCRLALERTRARLGDPRRLVNERRQAVDDLLGRGGQALRQALARRRRALAAEEARLLRAHPQRRIAEQRKLLQGLEHRLAVAARGRVDGRHRALDGLRAKLGSLSPLAVLERGYSLARRPDGHVVTQAAELEDGQALHLRFRDGEVRTRVERGAGDEAGGGDEPGGRNEPGGGGDEPGGGGQP
jgi:exodeoxyribonuclease VII large subunit